MNSANAHERSLSALARIFSPERVCAFSPVSLPTSAALARSPDGGDEESAKSQGHSRGKMSVSVNKTRSISLLGEGAKSNAFAAEQPGGRREKARARRALRHYQFILPRDSPSFAFIRESAYTFIRGKEIYIIPARGSERRALRGEGSFSRGKLIRPACWLSENRGEKPRQLVCVFQRGKIRGRAEAGNPISPFHEAGSSVISNFSSGTAVGPASESLFLPRMAWGFPSFLYASFFSYSTMSFPLVDWNIEKRVLRAEEPRAWNTN